MRLSAIDYAINMLESFLSLLYRPTRVCIILPSNAYMHAVCMLSKIITNGLWYFRIFFLQNYMYFELFGGVSSLAKTIKHK